MAKKMTAVAKIKKYCVVEKAEGAAGYVIRRGDKKLRVDKMRGMTDAEAESILSALGGDPAPAGAGKDGAGAHKCECGCGAVTGRRAKFRPGHDMKLKSRLLKGAASGNAGAKAELAARNWA